MHRIHPNFPSARSKFYDECLAKDLGVAESSQVKFAADLEISLSMNRCKNQQIKPFHFIQC
jgi:hypothetical protein